jgi:hypothetical protein
MSLVTAALVVAAALGVLLAIGAPAAAYLVVLPVALVAGASIPRKER